jgi:hypothetical protein
LLEVVAIDGTRAVLKFDRVTSSQELGAIKQKLEQGQFRTPFDLHAEVVGVWRQARPYTPHHQIALARVRLEPMRTLPAVLRITALGLTRARRNWSNLAVLREGARQRDLPGGRPFPARVLVLSSFVLLSRCH